MNGFALASIGILVHDGNDRASLGLDNTTHSDNREVGELVVINATHINSSRVLRLEDNPDITACKATIGTSINQRTICMGFMGRYLVGDLVNIGSQDAPNVTRKR